MSIMPGATIASAMVAIVVLKMTLLQYEMVGVQCKQCLLYALVVLYNVVGGYARVEQHQHWRGLRPSCWSTPHISIYSLLVGSTACLGQAKREDLYSPTHHSPTISLAYHTGTFLTRGTVPRGTVDPIPNGLSLWPRTMFRQVTPSPALNALPAEHEDIHSSISSMSWSVWWKHIHQRIVVFRAYTP